MNLRSSTKFLNLLIFVALQCGFLGCANSTRTVSASAAVTPPTKVEAVADAPRFPEEPTRLSEKRTLSKALPVSIQNDFGDVRLRFGGFADVLEVSAVAQAPIGSATPLLHFDEQTGVLSTRLPAGTAPVKGQRIDVVVFAPLGHLLSANTLTGLIEARGVRGDVSVTSLSGAITARGVQGAIRAQTGSGSIEVNFVDGVAGAQSLRTSTGQITAAFGPKANVQLALATSGLFASEFSLVVTPKSGQEPNKTATASLGPGGTTVGNIEISSKRGELRLYHRQEFVE
jgi:hypothetical protein